MVIALTTDPSRRRGGFGCSGVAVFWQAWRESRGRFFSALLLLSSIVIYAVMMGPGDVARQHSLYPGRPYFYSTYIWSGLFHYSLQGLWVLAALIMALGGLRRERATGTALFALGLPVTRLRLFLSRSAVACAEAFGLGIISAV
ncbi:MAG TPA: hypothetical protein VHC90_12755, partial [Bryobacteraceae bacterium]|nr:hypothetical protein [Bryobacteraceae bacterium]